MEYACLDAGKVIASLFVLFVHTEPLQEVSPLAEAVLLLAVMSRFLRWPQMLFLGGVLYAGATVVYALGTVLLLCESAGDFYRLQGAPMDLFLSLVVCAGAVPAFAGCSRGGVAFRACDLPAPSEYAHLRGTCLAGRRVARCAVCHAVGDGCRGFIFFDGSVACLGAGGFLPGAASGSEVQVAALVVLMAAA